MKTKLTLLFLFSVISFQCVVAQENDRPLRFMLLAEPHLSWLSPDEQHLAKGPVRFGGGAEMRLEYSFDRFYAFSLGVGIDQNGGNLIYKDSLYLDRITGFDTLVPGTRVTYRLQYVEIPLSIKFKTPQIGYTTYFAEAGLDPMFNIKTLIDATDNSILKEPFQQGIARFNLAYHTSLGYMYEFANGMALQVRAVYKNTFLDVTKESNVRKPDNARINQVAISFGIIF
jgi:hypothetical protein